jgi:hypothetical protein
MTRPRRDLVVVKVPKDPESHPWNLSSVSSRCPMTTSQARELKYDSKHLPLQCLLMYKLIHQRKHWQNTVCT